ncbi:MAG: AAA family ATPase [Jatrophihabitantaceae bacterium]
MAEPDLQHGPSLGRPAAVAVERAAHAVISAGFGRHDSAFTPGQPVWTSKYADELKQLFVDRPDVTGLSFDEKLDVQLGGASDGARQLFAELYYLNLLPLSDYRGVKKRALVTGVLARMTSPVTIPVELDEALDGGVFNGGVAFKTRRYWQLCLLIEFTRAFLARPEPDQRAALEDPLAFRSLLSTVAKPNEPAQRQSLLYLAYPDYYLPIVSGKHRQWIRDALADRIDDPSIDLDVDLHAILKVIGDVDLYQTPWLEMWNPKAKRASVDPAAAVVPALGDGDELIADATPELADALHVDQAYLQEWVELLRDRPQLIFYGPPGTGKTYIAQKLAEHIAGDNVTIVQFHPSTSYEDFFEGYRPEPGSHGQVGFRLKDGPLRKVARAAVEEGQENAPHVLIIDEINRGNLARIFGELYFLLEYRDHAVDLLYAREDEPKFRLPRNVIIIGTMNTADRSIALVDAAMRRRFAFVGLHPSEPPTSTVLRRWLQTNHPGGIAVADLLDELNARIDDRDFRIGPSYFMRDAVYAPAGLERVWRTAILPLLEEHHYGQGLDVERRYGYEMIRTAAASSREMTVEGEDAAATDAG